MRIFHTYRRLYQIPEGDADGVATGALWFLISFSLSRIRRKDTNGCTETECKMAVSTCNSGVFIRILPRAISSNHRLGGLCKSNSSNCMEFPMTATQSKEEIVLTAAQTEGYTLRKSALNTAMSSCRTILMLLTLPSIKLIS